MNADDLLAKFVEQEEDDQRRQTEDALTAQVKTRSSQSKTYESLSQYFSTRSEIRDQENRSGGMDCHLPLPPLFEDLSVDQQDSFSRIMEDFDVARAPRGHTAQTSTMTTVANNVVSYVGTALDVVQPRAQEVGQAAYKLGQEFYHTCVLEWYKNASTFLLNATGWNQQPAQIAAPVPSAPAVTTPGPDEDGFIASVTGWVQQFFTVRSREVDSETVEISLPEPTRTVEKIAPPPPAGVTAGTETAGNSEDAKEKNITPKPTQVVQRVVPPPSDDGDTSGCFIHVGDVDLINNIDGGDGERLPPMTTTTQGWGAPPETKQPVDALLEQFIKDDQAPGVALRETGRLPQEGEERSHYVRPTVGGPKAGYEVSNEKMGAVDALMMQFMEEGNGGKTTSE